MVRNYKDYTENPKKSTKTRILIDGEYVAESYLYKYLTLEGGNINLSEIFAWMDKLPEEFKTARVSLTEGGTFGNDIKKASFVKVEKVREDDVVFESPIIEYEVKLYTY